MSYGVMVEFAEGMEKACSGEGEPAFRFGRYPTGGECLSRGADSPPANSTGGEERVVIAVNWANDVAWRKRIRPFRRVEVCNGDMSRAEEQG